MDVNENPSGGERALDALLADAVRVGEVDRDSQARAVAAFRSARGGSGHRARTRRRDDWRPRLRRRGLGALRAAAGAALASLLLGGVAIASIGTFDQEAPAPPKKTSDPTRPSPTAPSPQPSAPSKAPTPRAEPSDRPSSKAKGDDKGKKKGKRSERPRGSHGRPTDLPPKPPKAHGKH
ncbi:hypothetical protein AB0H77_33575 [Streptomyces sp. NPDC050844]|uniref:hypothetical protein n=1 Tax=Streptomyces sp. NPDC050844 TaxID=3155790 RepID=UPI0033DF8097